MNIYVIADATVAGMSPAGWASKALALWHRLAADALVVEVNQGGDMVRTVIAEQDANVPVIAVHARRGKWLRAEPVAALYEQGRVKHVGAFPRWKTRCVILVWMVCRRGARPTGSTHWSGR
jgi:phage terminase large subunit-like protein